MAEASLAVKLEDNFSMAIIGMKNAVTPFRKDVTALQKELDMLTGSKNIMSIDLKAARIELKRTQDAYDALGESATKADRKAAKADFMKAAANFENIDSQYKLIGAQAKQTRRDILDASSAISKAENRAAKATPGILGGLGQVGLVQMGGQVASQWANILVSSSLGQDAGSYFGGALSGAATGAALGSIVPGVGTVVGGLAGGAIGLAGAGAQVYEQKNDAFKGYVQEMVGNAATKQEENAVSGIDTAAKREIEGLAFNSILGEGRGDAYLKKMRAMAADTPLGEDDLSGMSRALAPAFKSDTGRMLGLMTSIGNAGSAVGIDPAGMTEMAKAMSKMQDSGKANLEYLNIFIERGVDAVGMIGESLGKSKDQVYELISRGKIDGVAAVDAIQAGIDSLYDGAMEKQSKAFSGLSSTWEDIQKNINAATGASYVDAMSPEMAARNESYSGALGNEFKVANTMIGSGRAALDGEQMAYQDEARSVVLGLTENMQLDWGENAAQMQNLAEQYRDAKDAYASGDESAGLRVEKILSQTDILAQAQYENSEIYKKSTTAQVDLINAVQKNTAVLSASAGRYIITQASNKGLDPTGGSVGTNTTAYWGPKAFGLTRVPYDGYRSLLHEGERVLTASEARNYTDQSNRSSSISVSGNHFTVREEADISRIAAALADQIHLAQMGGVR